MKILLKILVLLFLLSSTLLTQAQILVKTLAGDGPSIFYNAFVGVAVDGWGNVYTTDFYQNRIKKITPNGVMTVFAGKGPRGNVNGIGTDAQFDQPIGIDVDAFGNVYVADQQNNVIRKITPDGEVTTFAGSGNIGTTNNIGILAEFANPSGVAVDVSGNIYVADTGNRLIRKITPDGQVSTLAGSGQQGIINGIGTEASFMEPWHLTVDVSGNVYVTDNGNNFIRKITSEGIVTTLAGTLYYDYAVGNEARLHKPSGMAADKDGNLYVADLYNNVIRKITPDGTISTYVGTGEYGMTNGLLTEATFGYPSDVAIDAFGNMYVSEDGNYLIRKISGKPITTSSTTGIEFFNAITDIKLYPIPASNQLRLSLTLKNESDVRFELINSNGAMVATTEAVHGAGYKELSLSVQSLPAGLYVANIYSGNEVRCQKVIITR